MIGGTIPTLHLVLHHLQRKLHDAAIPGSCKMSTEAAAAAAT